MSRQPQAVINRLLAMRGIRTATQLAEEFGLTKGIVIGIWHRAKNTPGYEKLESGRRLRPAAIKLAVVEPEPEPTVEAAPAPEPVSVVALPAVIEPKPQKVRPVPLFVGDHDQVRFTGAAAAIEAFDGGCRWPHGDPREAGFFFCCEPIARPGKPYCHEHHALAWGGRPESRHPSSYYRPIRLTGKEHAV